MTARLGKHVLVSITAWALLGCGQHAADTHCPDVDPSVPSASPASGGANAAEVTRFADEEPFGPTVVVSQDKTRVTKAPGGPDLVTTLPAGAEVMKLAAHGSDDLVCFDDPAGGRHLMGWVSAGALTDPPPSTPPNADDGGTQPPDPPPPHKGGHHHRGKKRPH